MDVEKQPHLHLTKKDMTPVVLVVGDPGRAALLASMCEKSTELAFNREYRSFKCTQNGSSFVVVSHGVGSAGCAICFEECIKLGAKVIIRGGTAGSLQLDQFKQGDICVCYASCREDGHSNLYAPAGLPAVADPMVFDQLYKVAQKHIKDVKYGISLTSDIFYPSPAMEQSLVKYQKSGVEVVEMEIATLFCICKMRGVKAGALVVVDGSPLKWDSVRLLSKEFNNVCAIEYLLCLEMFFREITIPRERKLRMARRRCSKSQLMLAAPWRRTTNELLIY